jgi:hypothetical protein
MIFGDSTKSKDFTSPSKGVGYNSSATLLMRISTIKKPFFISTFFYISCGQNNSATTDKLSNDTSKVTSVKTSECDTAFWLTPKNLTPYSFLEIMKRKGPASDNLAVIVMTDSFPYNWIKPEDIDSLIKLVNSKEKCNCFLNPLSSHIPNDSADIGGYAVALIASFKQKEKVSFGLYACPKTNKKDADELIQWWTTEKIK